MHNPFVEASGRKQKIRETGQPSESSTNGSTNGSTMGLFLQIFVNGGHSSSLAIITRVVGDTTDTTRCGGSRKPLLSRIAESLVALLRKLKHIYKIEVWLCPYLDTECRICEHQVALEQ